MQVTAQLVVTKDDAASAIIKALKALPDSARVKSVGTTGGSSGQRDMYYSPVVVTITFEWSI